MDRKVILSRYIKAVYRDLNKVIMCLVIIKNLGKSRRITDKNLFERINEYKDSIMDNLSSAMNDIESFYKWADSGCASLGIEHKDRDNIFSFHIRQGDVPADEIKVNRESIISVEKHFSGGALIKYVDGTPKEVITFEKFNEVISQLGFEVEYKNGRYITKDKSSKSIRISELQEKLDEILYDQGDIELEATFSIVRGDGDYKIRNTGDINRIMEFCKQKIEKPKEDKKPLRSSGPKTLEDFDFTYPKARSVPNDSVPEIDLEEMKRRLDDIMDAYRDSGPAYKRSVDSTFNPDTDIK